MKRYLLILGALLALSGHAQAATTPLAPVLTQTAPVHAAGPALLPMAGFLMLGLMTEYFDANGTPFPLCGVQGMKCYQEYPGPVHQDGV